LPIIDEIDEIVAGEQPAVALDDAAWDRPGLTWSATVQAGIW
jgi:hypothetical protein